MTIWKPSHGVLEPLRRPRSSPGDREATPPPEPTPVPTATAPEPPTPRAHAGATRRRPRVKARPPTTSTRRSRSSATSSPSPERIPSTTSPTLASASPEVALQAIVDPYARADFFLSFSESSVEVEEGFVTFTSLPGGLLAKVGRMRVSFGKINTLHLHVLPWPDDAAADRQPARRRRGMEAARAISLAHLIPMPADIFSGADGAGLPGRGGGALRSYGTEATLRTTATTVVFKDLSEATNLDLGFSYGRGPTPRPRTKRGAGRSSRRSTSRCAGSRCARATYRSASLRGELFAAGATSPRSSEESRPPAGGSSPASTSSPSAGSRARGSSRPTTPTTAPNATPGQAVIPDVLAERVFPGPLELRRRRYAGGITANEALLQLQFAIGAHGAHPF